MSEKTIVFDVDGCLADFAKGFTELGHKMFGTPVQDCLHQETWQDMVGDKGQRNEVWEVLKKDEMFWYLLEPLVNATTFARIDSLSLYHRVYFVTSRVGVKSKQQTERWLKFHGIYSPSVIISGLHDKGHLAKYLGATHTLEDKWENACDIDEHSDAASYLLTRKYNTTLVYDKRVSSVDQFINEVERG